MGRLNERNPSLWVKTSPEIRYRALSGKPSFDMCGGAFPVTQRPLILCADISFYLPTVHHGRPLHRAGNG